MVQDDIAWWARDPQDYDSDGFWVYPLVNTWREPATRDMRAVALWYQSVQLSQAGMLFWWRDGQVYYCVHSGPR